MESTGRMLREMLDGGSLERSEQALIKKVAESPGDTGLLHRFAEVLRQRGKLREAGTVYARIRKLAPDDPRAGALGALLRGRRVPDAPPLPTKFLIENNFLESERVEEIRTQARDRRDDFAPTAVLDASGRQEMDTEARHSESLTDLGALMEWFPDRVAAVVPRLYKNLRVPLFRAGLHSIKISAYHHGHFFGLHHDDNTGPAASRRFGFIYYFEFPPKRFSGGELILFDRDPDSLLPTASFTNLAPDHNTLAIIPANTWHEVLPIHCPSDDWFAGRFTLSGWIHDDDMLAVHNANLNT